MKKMNTAVAAAATPADGFLRHYQEDGRSWKGECQ